MALISQFFLQGTLQTLNNLITHLRINNDILHYFYSYSFEVSKNIKLKSYSTDSKKENRNKNNKTFQAIGNRLNITLEFRISNLLLLHAGGLHSRVFEKLVQKLIQKG